MAAKLEIPKDSPGRIRAGICYILTHNAFNGHTCLPEDRLKETAVKLLDVGEEVFDDNLSAACDDDELCVYDKDGRSFVFCRTFPCGAVHKHPTFRDERLFQGHGNGLQQAYRH